MAVGCQPDARPLHAAGCVGALGAAGDVLRVGDSHRRLPEARAEGAYLIVNKNLIEAAAVLVLLAFRTGRIAGLDLLVRAPAAANGARSRRSSHELTPEQTEPAAATS